MKVLVVGGGSGGHITPAVAVVRELLELRPRTRIEFWTDRKYYKNVVKITTELGVGWGGEDKSASVQHPYIRVRKVLSGKFRRYAGWTFKTYWQNLDVTLKDLVWGNIVGFFGFLCGLVQSFFRLVRPSQRPDVIFLKGGFVGLPVGLVARLLRIPYVIHESDMVPGLANRMLMKRARIVAWGFVSGDDEAARPENHVVVGIPVAAEFKKVSAAKKKSLKQTFGFDPDAPLTVITGGSQGSERMNEVTREILPELLKFTSVGLVAGRAHYEEMVDLKQYEEWENADLKSNFRLWEFSTVMNEVMGAADVVVSRAGATTIAELAALEKGVILVPFEKLPGGHQVKNAEQLEKAGAALVVRNDKMVKKPELLLEAVRTLVRSPKKRLKMAQRLHEFTRADAAKSLAEILVGVADGKEGK